MDIEPGMEVDRYRVEHLLGRGGMASVWKVHRSDLGVDYALKVLEAPGRSVRERLLAEARIQASLRHPNIVSLVDVLSIHGTPALVLEFVDGPSLDRLMAAHRLDLGQVDHVMRGILKGVRAAHRAGFVHRDLKPANLLLSRADDGFLPKIADFGLAKVLRDQDGPASRTRTGAFMGTPVYMAPEQFRSAKMVNEGADIYALGVIGYELCTGRPPYDDADLVELLDRIRARRYPPLLELAPQLPERMVATIERAMSVERSDRFASVDEMYEAWVGREGEVTTAWDRNLLSSFDGDSRTSTDNTTYDGSRAVAVRPRPAIARTPAPPSRASSLPSSPSPASTRTLSAAVALTGVAGVGAVVVAVAMVVVGVGVVGWSASGSLNTEVPVPVPVPAPPPVPVPVPPPPPVVPEPSPVVDVPAPVPTPPPPPPPAPPPPAPVVQPAPVRPAPPPPAPVETGTIRAEGGVTLALTDAAGGSWSPGAVPPGTYGYVATFGDGSQVKGSVQVAVGGTRTVACNASFGNSCAVR